MSKIQIQSRRVRQLLQLLLIAIPIGVVYFWLTIETRGDILRSSGLVQLSFDISSYTQHPLSMTTRLLAMTASLLLSCVPLFAVNTLIKLFRNYERNEIFSLENTHCYRKLGYCLFFWVGGSIIYGTLMSLTLSFNNPPGERMITVGFVGMDLLNITLGFLVLIISWVMKEGQSIADENDQTI